MLRRKPRVANWRGRATAIVVVTAAVLLPGGDKLLGPVGAATDGVSSDRLCAHYGGVPSSENGAAPAGMIRVPGGTFTMGSDEQRPEESAAHQVSVAGFWIDRHEVTNAQFARFVEATGHVTVAERGLDPEDYPRMPPDLLVPGSMVFEMPDAVAKLADVTQWWRYVAGADWRHPTGPGSSIEGKESHPVVQVAYEDALAYARWAGKSLPTEAQWEFAARGGLEGATYTWGDRYEPIEGWKANTWQGNFPVDDRGDDGHHGTAPVGCFEPNGYALFDMAGNVWEWAVDWYVPGHPSSPTTEPSGPQLFRAAAATPDGLPRRVIKGGSWLCADNFCGRYRPSARQPMEADLGASHIGFRTVLGVKG